MKLLAVRLLAWRCDEFGGWLYCCRVLPGEADWMVVRVVVKERCDWFGLEKVLFPPAPSVENAPPAVVAVKALLCPASLCTVSELVATVGAADLLLFDCASFSFSMLRGMLSKLSCLG